MTESSGVVAASAHRGIQVVLDTEGVSTLVTHKCWIVRSENINSLVLKRHGIATCLHSKALFLYRCGSSVLGGYYRGFWG